jgi:predicted DNA-binding transcriptional regulator YafY
MKIYFNVMSDSVLRMIKMTELIKRYPVKVTATEIKQGLDNFGYETSLRTVQRDLNELSRIFPIECDDRSTPFGWSWKKDSPGYEFPAMDPIQALTFSLAAQYLEPLMPKASFKRVEKFFKRAEKVLTGNEKSNVLRWRKRVRVIPETIRFKEAPVKSEIRQKIYQAVFEGIQLKALYRKRGEKEADLRHMHPMAIVVKGSMTYLICMMDEDPITPRYLPIHRFKEVELLTDQKIKQPENFSLDDFIHTNNLGFTNSDKLYTFKAIFNKTMAAHLTETKLNGTQTEKELSDGRLLVTARVPDTLQFEQWLMSFGADVEVLAPKALRAKFKELALKLKDIY